MRARERESGRLRGQGEGRIDGVRDLGAVGAPVRLAGDDDVAAPGEGPEARRQRVPRLAAHDDGGAQRHLLEVGEVFRQMPRHDAITTDGAVGGLRPDQADTGAGCDVV